jgi:replicative DNA helicase
VFGIPEIDERMLGVKRKTLNVFQSQRSSSGKTTALVHLAKTYVMQGKKVLIFTTEDGEEAYQDKLDMSICGLFQEELDDADKIRKCMMNWYGNSGDVYIKEVDCMSATVSDLRDFTTFLENTENFKPDAILIDYADELIPAKGANYSTFDAYRIIYGELRGWAQEENCVIWTAQQSNRGGEEGEHADMGSAGMSIAKTWIPDLIITINRNSAQEEDGETDLFFAKDRHGKARWSVVIQSDFERGRFYTKEKLDG